jgi:hypothetical protein
MRNHEILPHAAVDRFEKAHSAPYSLAELRERLTEFAPETEVFFRVATRDDRTDGLYIQFLPVTPVVYPIAEFVAKLSGFTSETEFLAVFRRARRGYCAPYLYVSQLAPIPSRVR